jgi:hypothetical protein
VQYAAPILALIAVISWVAFELIERSRVVRLVGGAVAIALAVVAGWYLGRFAEWNKRRLYPVALIEIANELREGEAARVERAIAQVFESGGDINEVTSIEFMQALEQARTTGTSK